MIKNELIEQLSVTHNVFVVYINSLTIKKFQAQIGQKWSAGQELDHIVKSVAPLSKVLHNKSIIIENFGRINRPILNYIELTNAYKNELKKGAIAIGRFIPETEIKTEDKAELINALLDHVSNITNDLANFTEDELYTLVLPNPVLGRLTIREMIFFTIYHVGHHKQNIQRNLRGSTFAV